MYAVEGEPSFKIDPMKTMIRSLAFTLVGALGTAAIAQNVVTVTGTVSPCVGMSYPVHITTNTVPAIDTTVYTGANCMYSFTFYPIETQGTVGVETSCDGGVTWNAVVGSWNPFLGTVVLNLSCNGVPSCNACFSVSSTQPWVVEFTNCTSGGSPPFMYEWTFSDGSVSSQTNPVWTLVTPGVYMACLTITDANACTSTTCDSLYVDDNGGITTDPIIWDCLGVPNGAALPGTPCTTWQGAAGVFALNCTCIPTGTGPLNDECYNPTIISANATCIPTSGDMTGATESWSPSNCGNFISGSANDVWFAFVATGTSATIQATGDGTPADGLDLVLEVFTDSCGIGALDCADATFAGGSEELTLTTTPGTTYYYRLYPFTGPATTTFTYTTCVISNSASLTDCEGVIGGSALPGTPCTALGVIGTWSTDCTCIPNTPLECEAAFWVMQGYETDPNDPNAVIPIPNELWIWNLSNSSNMSVNLTMTTTVGSTVATMPAGCNSALAGASVSGPNILTGTTIASVNCPNVVLSQPAVATGTASYVFTGTFTGNYQFVWSWGDGTPDSTDPYPTHFYASGGPYVLCLTMTDDLGCTDTACDSISVDGNGIYTGMILEESYARSGFTVNVLNQLPTGIPDRPAMESPVLWPNPVDDVINLSFNTTLTGNLPMTIIDLNGREVRKENVRITSGGNKLVIPVNELVSGIYLVRFGNDEKAVSFRFVKR